MTIRPRPRPALTAPRRDGPALLVLLLLVFVPVAALHAAFLLAPPTAASAPHAP